MKVSSDYTESKVLARIVTLTKQCERPETTTLEECQKCQRSYQTALSLATRYKLIEKRFELLRRMAQCQLHRHAVDKASRYVDQIFKLLHQGYTYPDHAVFYCLQAHVHWQRNELQEAVESYKVARELFRQSGHMDDVAGLAQNLSNLLRSLGRTDESLEYIQAAINGFRDLGNELNLNLAISSQANIMFSLGRYSEALALKRGVLEYFQQAGNEFHLGAVYNSLSAIYCKMMRIDKAVEYALASLKIKEHHGNPHGIAKSLENLASYYGQLLDYESAMSYHMQALDIFESLGDRAEVAFIHSNLANIACNKGELDKARELYEKAMEAFKEIGHQEELAKVTEAVGSLYADELQDYDKALGFFLNAADISRNANDDYHLAKVNLNIASVMGKLGRFSEAMRLLEAEERRITDNGFVDLKLPLLQSMIVLDTGVGNHETACVHYQQLINEMYRIEESTHADQIAEMRVRFEVERVEREVELTRKRNAELEEKNRQIETQRQQLQETLNKLHYTEIRYDFISEEVNKGLKTTMIGKSESMKRIVEMIATVAQSDIVNVLILGETGTGKEIVARNIHNCSSRSKNHLYSVNCSAVPEALFESQFFGHEKDAFTGASTTKIGWFEIADKSTLFLDEVATLSLEHQAKLLRCLEERSVVRVGSHREIPVNVRLISASNVNLLDLVKKGLFRQDMYHRIAVFVIGIPPPAGAQGGYPSASGSLCPAFRQGDGEADREGRKRCTE